MEMHVPELHFPDDARDFLPVVVRNVGNIIHERQHALRSPRCARELRDDVDQDLVRVVQHIPVELEIMRVGGLGP